MKRPIASLPLAAVLLMFGAAAASANHAVFESDRYDSPEDASFVEVRVFLTDTGEGRRPSPGESLEYRTEDVDATAGADYSSTAGTVQFQVGEEAKTIRIPLLDDAHAEGVEAFTVHARNTLGGSWSMTTVFLEDGEGPPQVDQFAAPEGTPPNGTAEAHAPARERVGPAGVETPSAPDRPTEAAHGTDTDLQVGTGFELSTGAGPPVGPADEPSSDSNSSWTALGAVGAVLVASGAALWRRRSRWSPTQP